MKLYMVRHGQSETNLARKYTGWGQINLTEQGVADAKRIGKFLQGMHFDRIYASDLVRAIQTAQYAIPGCEPILMPELREIGLGSLELRPVEECIAEYGPQHVEDRKNYDFTRYGGENNDMLARRVSRFLKMLEDDPADCVVAFAHAGVLQCALDLVVGCQLDRSHLRCANGSAALFCYEHGRWTLAGWGLGL